MSLREMWTDEMIAKVERLEAENARLRAALAETCDDMAHATAVLEGCLAWNAEAVQKRRGRIAELRKEFGL